MKAIKSYRVLAVGITVWFLLLAMHQVSHAREHSNLQPDEIQFSDDFSGDEIGSIPKNWTIRNADGDHGAIEVIAEPEIQSGKALRVVVGPHEENLSVSMSTALESLADDPARILIEYKVRMIEGKSLGYIRSGGSNRIAWWTEPGVFVFNMGGGVQEQVAINSGWNLVQIIADRPQNQAVVYINGTPLIGPVPFLREITSWEGTVLQFAHWSHQRNGMFYGDFKVWALD